MADASSGASSSVAHLVEQPDRPYQSAEAMPGQVYMLAYSPRAMFLNGAHLCL